MSGTTVSVNYTVTHTSTSDVFTAVNCCIPKLSLVCH